MRFKKLITIFLLASMIFDIVISVIGINVVYAQNDIYNYEGYTDDLQYPDFKATYYIRKIGSLERGEMVFCFNRTKTPPNKLGKEELTRFKKIEGSSENFLNNAISPTLGKDEFKNKVLSIIWKAYHDNTFNRKDISDGSLRKVTQLAIWKYTDNYDIDSKDNYLNSNKLTETEKLVYFDLIDSNSKPDNFELDLYLSENNNFQHLLGTKIINWKKEIKLIKKDFDTKKILAGAIFSFVSGDGFSGRKEEFISSNIDTTIEVNSGVYRVIEKKAPIGYQKDDINSVDGKIIKIDDKGYLYLREFDNNYNIIWTRLENNELVFFNKKDPNQEEDYINPIGKIRTTVKVNGVASKADKAVEVTAKDAKAGVTVVDTIHYEGLVAGKKYNVTGEIYEVNGGQKVGEAKAKATKVFTANQAVGDWELDFGKVTGLEADKTYVVYETASSEENLVDSNKDNKPDKKHELEHKDPNDKAQTVVVKEEDQVVDKGNKLTVTDKDSPKVEINAPKTGDINNITGVIVSLVISILGMTTLVLRYRKN